MPKLLDLGLGPGTTFSMRMRALFLLFLAAHSQQMLQ
jgi:hypothetical protein